MYVDALPFCLMFPQIERRFCIKWSTRSSCNGPCSTFYSSYSILNNAASHHTQWYLVCTQRVAYVERQRCLQHVELMRCTRGEGEQRSLAQPS